VAARIENRPISSAVIWRSLRRQKPPGNSSWWKGGRN
jgi:hypothetical protein